MQTTLKIIGGAIVFVLSISGVMFWTNYPMHCMPDGRFHVTPESVVILCDADVYAYIGSLVRDENGEQQFEGLEDVQVVQ